MRVVETFDGQYGVGKKYQEYGKAVRVSQAAKGPVEKDAEVNFGEYGGREERIEESGKEDREGPVALEMAKEVLPIAEVLGGQGEIEQQHQYQPVAEHRFKMLSRFVHEAFHPPAQRSHGRMGMKRKPKVGQKYLKQSTSASRLAAETA